MLIMAFTAVKMVEVKHACIVEVKHACIVEVKHAWMLPDLIQAVAALRSCSATISSYHSVTIKACLLWPITWLAFSLQYHIH